MAILTNPGRAAIAVAVKAQEIHMAWGRGQTSWDGGNTPAESIDAAALTAEFGRRRASQVLFCTPDANGPLFVPSGRFSPSDTPTKYLYMRFSFDFNDSPSEAIREIGIFMGTVAKPTVPAGQDYLLPSEVQDPGNILSIEHLQRIDRNAQTRQQFEFVIQF